MKKLFSILFYPFIAWREKCKIRRSFIRDNFQSQAGQNMFRLLSDYPLDTPNWKLNFFTYGIKATFKDSGFYIESYTWSDISLPLGSEIIPDKEMLIISDEVRRQFRLIRNRVKAQNGANFSNKLLNLISHE